MNKFLFVDTLTTGMNPERCAIYRLGALYVEDGVEKKALDIKVRPYNNARISQQSLWIGGETRSTLIHYPSEDSAFGDLLSFLNAVVDVRNSRDKIYIGGYNCSAFDIPFLREWFIRMDNQQFRNYFNVQSLDMMNIAAMALISKRESLPDFQMQSVASYLGIHTIEEEKYDCLQNARTALKIYRKLQTAFGLGICQDESETEDVTRNY
jgi:uncharacterized protein YprB with RNaseH-like and TPR domain